MPSHLLQALSEVVGQTGSDGFDNFFREVAVEGISYATCDADKHPYRRIINHPLSLHLPSAT